MRGKNFLAVKYYILVNQRPRRKFLLVNQVYSSQSQRNIRDKIINNSNSPLRTKKENRTTHRRGIGHQGAASGKRSRFPLLRKARRRRKALRNRCMNNRRWRPPTRTKQQLLNRKTIGPKLRKR